MRERSTKDSSFPHWVALGSLVFVLGLFFSNTAPALHERQRLRNVQDELFDLRQQYGRALDRIVRQTGPGLADVGPAGPGGDRTSMLDLQSLLVAIDRQGYTPRELFLSYPPRPGETPEQSLAAILADGDDTSRPR